MMNRRDIIFTGLAAGLLPSLSWAEEVFPQRPVRVVVPFGPGGLADITMRLVGERLSPRLGQPVIIVNQPGAGGVSAAQAALSAPRDGHTLAMLTNGTAISATLVRNAGFDPLTDFVPVGGLARFDFVIATEASQSYRTLTDLIGAARRAPGQINIGTINPGSTQHLAANLLKSLTGADFTIIPYRATPDVMAAAARKDVHAVIDGYSGASAMITNGQLRALATTGAARCSYLPNVPTAIESGVKDYEVTSWNALFAPKGTPASAIQRIGADLKEALKDQALARRLTEVGIDVDWQEPAATAERLRLDIARWAKVIESAGIEKQ